MSVYKILKKSIGPELLVWHLPHHALFRSAPVLNLSPSVVCNFFNFKIKNVFVSV